MKIKILKSFSIKLAHQIDYIANDKPVAAKKFKKDVLKALKSLEDFPFKNKKSIYFTKNVIL